MIVVGWLLASLVLLGCAWGARRSRARRRWIVATLAVWMLGALLFGTVLALEAGNTHDLVSQGCPRPNDSSEMLAPSHWSWLPPGEVCEFPNGDARPSSARLVVTCSLAAIPILVVMLWPKSRRAVLINA